MLGPMLAAREASGLDVSTFSIAISATVERPAEKHAGTATPEALHLHASTITGDAAQIASQLNEFMAVGATHFLLSLRAEEIGQLHDDIEWFSSEVMPLLEREVRQAAIGTGMDRKGGTA